MAEIQVLDASTGKSSKQQFEESVFGEKLLGKTLREAVLMYEANLRQGNADTKERNEVAGSTKKLYKQKHTGNARQGSKRAPHWRGGGTVFGPTPRDFGWAIPRKALKSALRSALLGKFRDGEVSLLKNLKLEKPSAKQARTLLNSLTPAGSSCVVLEDWNEVIWKSFRNFPRVKVTAASSLNAFDVCLYRHLLLTEPALQSLQARVVGGEKSEDGSVAVKEKAAKVKAPVKKAAPAKAKKTTTKPSTKKGDRS